jgi:DNA-binding MarR family transcriptional regulator
MDDTTDGATGEAAPLSGVWWDAWRGIVFTNARVLREVSRDLEAGQGLSLATLDVLSRLYDAPDRQLRMQELQDRLLFTYSGVTRLVDRIEHDGLVRRERVPTDRRGVYAVLTDEGARTYERGIAQHRADVERVFASRLTPPQHQAVADALRASWDE